MMPSECWGCEKTFMLLIKGTFTPVNCLAKYIKRVRLYRPC
jgi:hypothetical protein